MEQHPSPSVRTVFAHALEIHPPALRQAYLTDTCGDDSALRQQVDALLQEEAARKRHSNLAKGAA